ncbi:DUF2490 domain-containing protein [Portibacter marinus]|uniref:DUF2490 domain-containing protein n=1 Tax=Portibacter marinus TaxID=2898660 RepID=UPI001F26B280|nr:DUF2490 domain-containing protein [Portibacter marinus]
MESRTGATLTYELNKDLQFSIEEQVRLKSYDDLFDENIVELGARYDFLKVWKLGLGYRFFSSNDDTGDRQGIRIGNRLHYRLSYELDFDRSEIELRGQFQHRKERDLDKNWSPWEDQTMRYKIEFQHDIRNWKLDPELALEFFDEDLGQGLAADDKFRAILGTTWRLPGPQALKFKLMYEFGVGVSEQIPTYIIAINYTYDMD